MPAPFIILAIALMLIQLPPCSASKMSRRAVLPISGTFLDVQYDGRLKYANNATFKFSCSDWTAKMQELQAFGIAHIIIQAVHDVRWGAYYNSSTYPSWRGTCPDVVGAVLKAAGHLGMKVWLSAENVYTDEDNVTDPALMRGRLNIMSELVQRGYTRHPSFEGWYFASEAYLAPYFTNNFLIYIAQMADWARTMTPNAKRFISPFGTRFARDDATYTKQLQSLAKDVDIIAYQDEVGCVRDAFPVKTSAEAFRTLRSAHDQAGGRPALWANIESFTWEALPNNVTSALIPAPFPRILAQAVAVTAAGVDRTISFTMESLYEKPRSIVPWGPAAAEREYESYRDYFVRHTLHSTTLASCIDGVVMHAGIGMEVHLENQPDPLYSLGKLTDGRTGGQTYEDSHWLGFGQGVDVIATVTMPTEYTDISSVGAHFLAVPSYYYVDGHRPAQRNVTVWLPDSVHFAISNDTKVWTEIGQVHTHWWEQETYDIRTELYLLTDIAVRGKYLRLIGRNHKPPWVSSGVVTDGRLFLDEIVINHKESHRHEVWV